MADLPQAEVVHPEALQSRLLRLSQQRLRSFTKQNERRTCWKRSTEKINIAQYVITTQKIVAMRTR